MNRFFIFITILFLSAQTFGQAELNQYNFVVVPSYFEMLGQENQYQLNDMAKFYLEKKGFIVVSANEVFENSRCNGLYADVEQIKSLFGTRLQFVLKDCNKNEIYRSKEGRSKHKEFEKAYQDALRTAMSYLPKVGMKPLEKSDSLEKKDKIENNVEPHLPSLQTYQKDGKSFLIRKTSNGHSLYEESHTGDLNLIGNFKYENGIQFIDNDGRLFQVHIDSNHNLIMKDKDGKEKRFQRN